MDAIYSAKDLFDLPSSFRRCSRPDFVLMAIGDTTRGAIERAYDWLIPVISSLPEVIGRLPASAACFLLLQAYGSEGDRNKELRELSAPLLDHVQETILGRYGEDDAAGAANLLLADMADKISERRQCARRVLQQVLGHLGDSSADPSLEQANCGWLDGILHIDHIKRLLPDAIHHLSGALGYERGRVLRALVGSLKKYMDLASKWGLPGDWNFSQRLCELVSSRRNVCAEAMNRFVDFQDLCVNIIHDGLIMAMKTTKQDYDEEMPKFAVQLIPCRSYKNGEIKQIHLSLSLLRSTCVLLSTWRPSETSGPGASSESSINELANVLMFPHDTPQSVLLEADGVEGVASAKIIETGKPAVLLDEVSGVPVGSSIARTNLIGHDHHNVLDFEHSITERSC